MARKSKDEVEEIETTEKAGSVSVRWKGGVRSYTREVHGADYKKLAEEFAEKKNGTVV
jgi:hypothetical protein